MLILSVDYAINDLEQISVNKVVGTCMGVSMYMVQVRLVENSVASLLAAWWLEYEYASVWWHTLCCFFSCYWLDHLLLLLVFNVEFLQLEQTGVLPCVYVCVCVGVGVWV